MSMYPSMGMSITSCGRPPYIGMSKFENGLVLSRENYFLHVLVHDMAFDPSQFVLAYIISVFDMSKTGGGQWERAPAPIRRKNDTPLTYGDDSTHPHPIATH